MRLLLAVLLFIVFEPEAKALGESIRRERGAFTVGVTLSASEFHLLNQDGTFTKYKGNNYGGFIDIRLLGEGLSELRLFGALSKDDLKYPDNDTDKLQNGDSLVGLKAYANPFFFLGIGYGETSQTLTTSIDSITVKNPVVGLGAGLEYPVSASLVLGIHAWYKTNVIKKESSVSGNSFSEGYQAGLVLMWSPPSVTTILTTGGR